MILWIYLIVSLEHSLYGSDSLPTSYSKDPIFISERGGLQQISMCASPKQWELGP